ncbi:MAG: hypothetical protein J7576_09505 [Siphonobacter aquaeclarae]|nr:hypothetical protein [Siphonobacter aquaeclarae]
MFFTEPPRLPDEWISRIRNNADTAEQQRELAADTLSLFFEQGWFKMLAPRSVGGLQWGLPRAIRLEEAVAYADGSAGWVLTLCSGAGWFGGFMDPVFAGEVFRQPQALLAGSGAATGEAERLPDGQYRVNGRWNYASGTPHATHFTANCVLTENGIPVLDDDNQPVIRPFAFLRSEVTPLDTWRTVGLIASASHSFEIQNCIVPAERTFLLDPQAVRVDDPLYRYPFLPFAEATLAVNLSGMAVHFLEECEGYFRLKKTRGGITVLSHLGEDFERQVRQLDDARQQLFRSVDESWEACRQDRFSDGHASAIHDHALGLASAARMLVDTLYPYGGLTAADPSHVLNRIWRDLHTASQHSLLMP